MTSKALSQFLGTERWGQLFRSLKAESNTLQEPPLPTVSIVTAIVIAFCPVLITLLDDYRPRNAPPTILPTVAFGISALLALLFRSRLRFAPATVRTWKEALGLTHTGVALGCIPAVLVFCFSPNLLADRHDTLMVYIPGSHAENAPQISFLGKLLLISSMALWVSVTEEVIFRGFLVSAIRRWGLIPKQRTRDVMAIVVSTIVFGAAHFPTWGPYAATALTGLGLGFVIGYIANGERLFPLILYHFIFDALSLFIATR